MGLLEQPLDEDGIFYILASIGAIIAGWLVVNFESDPRIFFGFGFLLLVSIVYRFVKDSPYFDSINIFSDKPHIDIILGLVFSAAWYFALFPTKYGVLPLPPLPAEVLAVGPAAFLSVVLLAPIAEEYFFRGSLLPQIKSIFGRYDWFFAIVISALLFSLFHWTVYLRGALSSALIASFIFGLYVGGITYWRKQLSSAIIIHAIVNFLIVSPQYVMILL